MTIKSTSKESIIAFFESSEFDFYLTGSRFFEIENNNSDIDFFVSVPLSKLPALDKFLKLLHFRKIVCAYGTEEKRRDQGIIDIYYSYVYDCHVQVVEDAKQKYEIQKILKENGIFKFIELLPIDARKDFAARIWSTIYKTINSIKKVNND